MKAWVSLYNQFGTQYGTTLDIDGDNPYEEIMAQLEPDEDIADYGVYEDDDEDMEEEKTMEDFRIFSNHEYRMKCETLYFIEKSIKELRPADYKLYLNRNENIIDLKRTIREYAHRKSDRKYFAESDYGYYKLLIELPEYIKTYEDADEYFKEEEFMTCRPSQYDCIGQHFTLRYKIFKRNGRFMAYHECGMDV